MKQLVNRGYLNFHQMPLVRPLAIFFQVGFFLFDNQYYYLNFLNPTSLEIHPDSLASNAVDEICVQHSGVSAPFTLIN